MARIPEQEIGVKQPPGFIFYFLLGIIIVLCLQAVTYLLLMDSTIGRFSLFAREEPPDPALAREVRAVVLRSEATATMFPENPLAYHERSEHWAGMLERMGIPFRVVTEAELRDALADASVLVLPGVACLGEAEREAIDAFLTAGKGVLASGGLGVRDGDCAWQGGGYLSQLLSAGEVTNATPLTNTFAAFRGEQYFSERVPTGYLLALPSQELTLVAGTEPDAFWSDLRLRPAQGEAPSEAGLAAHKIHSGGRVVWFGFSEVVPGERVADRMLVEDYLAASVRWVGKQPLVILGNWPDRNQAAVVVAQEAEGDLADAQASAQLLRREGVDAVHILSAEKARQNPQVVETFQTAGEVATLGDSSEVFAGLTARQQARRLIDAKQALEPLVGEKVVGFAPPQGLSDVATVMALNDAGYQYYLNESQVSRAVPESLEFTQSPLFPMQKATVTKIFRTSADDFELMAGSGGDGSADLVQGFLSDFRRLQFIRGVYTLYFHSYLLGSAEHRQILGQVVRNIKTQSAWITTGKELVHWWLARHRVQVQAQKISVHRIRLDVANLGEDDLENATVYLYLPYRPQQVQLRSGLFHLQVPRYRMLDQDQILRVDFSKLSGQTNYSYLVVMDE